MLGLGYAMEGGICPVWPTRIGLGEKYECLIKNGVWNRSSAGVIFLVCIPIFSY